jgi:hypothetical protein
MHELQKSLSLSYKAIQMYEAAAAENGILFDSISPMCKPPCSLFSGIVQIVPFVFWLHISDVAALCTVGCNNFTHSRKYCCQVWYPNFLCTFCPLYRPAQGDIVGRKYIKNANLGANRNSCHSCCGLERSRLVTSAHSVSVKCKNWSLYWYLLKTLVKNSGISNNDKKLRKLLAANDWNGSWHQPFQSCLAFFYF